MALTNQGIHIYKRAGQPTDTGTARTAMFDIFNDEEPDGSGSLPPGTIDGLSPFQIEDVGSVAYVIVQATHVVGAGAVNGMKSLAALMDSHDFEPAPPSEAATAFFNGDTPTLQKFLADFRKLINLP